MAEDGFQITVDDRDLQEKLAKLDKAVFNTKPFFEEVGEILKTSIVRNFEVGGRYSVVGDWHGGNLKWQETVAKTGRKILVKESLLLGSINWQAGLDSVEVGSNVAYSAIHNFGGKAGINKSVDIPGRPFLVVQDEDLEQIVEVAEEFILRGI